MGAASAHAASDQLATLLGLVVFLCVMGGVLYRLWFRHVLHHQRAKTSFPAVADELGLKFKRAKEPKKIGKLKGKHRGYRVTIDADEHDSSAKFKVKLNTSPELVLTRLRWGAFRGKERVDFPHPRLNRFFKTRLAPPTLAGWLGQSRQSSQDKQGGGYRLAAPVDDERPDVAGALAAFVDKWGGQLRVCELNHDTLGCSLSLGSGENTVQSVTGDQVHALLPDMVALAEALDSMPTSAELG